MHTFYSLNFKATRFDEAMYLTVALRINQLLLISFSNLDSRLTDWTNQIAVVFKVLPCFSASGSRPRLLCV